jgi:hypothetical protein
MTDMLVRRGNLDTRDDEVEDTGLKCPSTNQGKKTQGKATLLTP